MRTIRGRCMGRMFRMIEVLKGNQVTPAPAHKFVGTVAKYFVIAKNDK